MNIPTSRDLLHPMLQVAREHSRLAEGELHRFLAFQFGAYEGGPAIAKPSDVRRFACRVRVARRALLRHGMLASGAGDSLTITPHGEAYLTTGWLRTDAGTQPASLSEGAAVASSGAAVGSPSLFDQAADSPSPTEDDTGAESDEPEFDLKALLDEAKVDSIDLGSGCYQVDFAAEMRTWNIYASASRGWLQLCTHVMTLPKAPGARALTLDLMARLSRKVPLAKFSASRRDCVVLELQYRTEHVDAEALDKLIGLLLQIAEDEYPGLLWVAEGKPALQALDAAFRRPK